MKEVLQKLNQNKKIKIYSIIFIISLIFLWYYETYILVDNVFDYMYYSRAEQKLFINENEIETLKYNYHEPENPKQFVFDLFGNNMSEVQELKSEYYFSSNNIDLQDSYIFVDSKYGDIYNEPTNFDYEIESANIKFGYILYLQSNDKPNIYYNIGFEYVFMPHTNTLYPEFCLEESEGKNGLVFYQRSYKEGEEILAETGITAEDLETIHHWLLYERILNDFFNYNEGKTRFSIDDLGDIKIAELNT